ncbi:pectinesterase family protein [Zhihengliuella halotolerans]|uniref:Pectinesterase n=1 Tax=Zhihengliuella halotolerans TaxID=370736 RepID=A0A4Q8AG01_9MICC|nr:pectinesterase family protein [Zhihengliuella halotolerans]RZU63270.1 pectinesterase [Zhihengliuella halotolerans]
MEISTLSRRAVLRTLGLAAGSAALVSASGAAALATGTTPPSSVTSAAAAGAERGPVVFVVGDSTASAYEHDVRPRTGWGQSLALLTGKKASVFDYAWSGASSKSFADAGKLDTVLDLMRSGDYLLISFGHNDSKTSDPDRGTDPDTTYKEYLSRYIDGARAKGGHPVLVTSVERRRFDAAGNARATHGEYPRAVRELAAATGTPLVDLAESSRALWQRLGPDGTLSHFLHLAPGEHPQFPDGSEDNTHFHAVGALAVARLVAAELVKKGIVPGSWFTRLDAQIDPLAETYWPPERPVDEVRTIDVGPGGDFASVQAAVDSVASRSSQRTVIRIAPGTYREIVRVGSDKERITFLGLGEKPQDTVLVYDNASGTPHPDGGTYGTTGSTSIRVDAAYFHAENLTFANDFDEAAHPEITSRQAVALRLAGDYSVLRNVRCLGNQDTLYVNSPSTGVQARFLFESCHVVGDVDFIFGRGTAVFDACRIVSLDRGESNNGYVTANSVDQSIKHGYLFDGCEFASPAARRTVHLGRPWHPGGDPDAIAQVLVRDSFLGDHIKASPWTDMSGFSWKTARFAEHHNRGPGSFVTADRPQMSVAKAAEYTPAAYLAGSDGWAPQLARTSADSVALLNYA